MNGGELLGHVGLLADGPAVLGRPARAALGGVYVIELPAPLPAAPLDIARIGKWIERVPDLRLDGEPPTAKQLASRLAAFWLPSQTVLFVGSSTASIAGRLRALDAHVLGDPKPHAAAQWLKALRPDTLRAWWAATDAPEEYEDALMEAFAEQISAEERRALPDQDVVLPWANLRRPAGARKRTGLTGTVIPIVPDAPRPPTTVVELPPGDAVGVPEARNSGTVRRTNVVPPRPRAPREPAAPRPRAPKLSPRSRPAAEPVHFTADGLDRMRAELTELTTVRRPQVIERIVRAREHGDLKENADYTAAREEQSFLEGRVQAIEERLRLAVVVESPSETHRVVIGSRVTTEFLDEQVVYEIVGSDEADPAAGRISNASPVGRALLGKAVGDEAVVQTPRGEARYRVVAIE